MSKKHRTPEFNLQLNEEQKKAKSEILNNDIIVIKGQAGTGKTLLACQVALDLFSNKDIEKIIISRPLVTAGNEELGFLPGSAFDKTLPYLVPIYSNMYQLWDKVEIDALVQAGDIEICPLAFLRGRTFVNSLVIVDEAQNCTHSQLEGILGRLGKGSKMIICGDMSQCDLQNKKESGLEFLKNLISVPRFKIVTLEANHRHSIVEPILKIYKEFRD